MLLSEPLAQTKTLDNTALIAQLVSHGVHYLRAVNTAPLTARLPPEQLIYMLAQHPEPRFRESLIVLFLRQPSYSRFVPKVVAWLKPEAAEVLRHMYTAAVYLQRLWYGVLELYVGHFPTLPDYYGQSVFHLPPPEEYYGEAGLYALANHFQTKTGFTWLSTYQATVALLLDQLRLDQLQLDQLESTQVTYG